MVEVSVWVPVAAAQEQVFAALTNWRRQSEWMLGTRVGVTGGDGQSVGSTVEAFTGVGPLGVTDTMKITAWHPPLHVVVQHTGTVVRGAGEFWVRPAEDGTSSVEWREDLDLPLAAVTEWGWPLIRPVFAGGVRYSLRRFARFAEQYAA